MSTVIDTKELMETTCETYRNIAMARHMEVCVLTAAEVSGTLHLHIAVRSDYLTKQLIDGLLANCAHVSAMVLGLEFEGFVYVPRGWTEATGSASETHAPGTEGVLPDKEPGSVGGIEETGTRRRRRSRSSTQS